MPAQSEYGLHVWVVRAQCVSRGKYIHFVWYDTGTPVNLPLDVLVRVPTECVSMSVGYTERRTWCATPVTPGWIAFVDEPLHDPSRNAFRRDYPVLDARYMDGAVPPEVYAPWRV